MPTDLAQEAEKRWKNRRMPILAWKRSYNISLQSISAKYRARDIGPLYIWS